MPGKHQLSPEDRQWLEELQAQTLVFGKPTKSGYKPIEEQRQFTEEEWSRLKTLIAAHELPVLMGIAPLGFCGIVFDHTDVPDMKPPRLLYFEWFQMPGVERGFENQPAASRKLWKIVATARNKELLAFYGFKPLDGWPESYCY